MFGLGKRVKRVGPDRFELRLPHAERAVLRSLPGQLRQLLVEDDPTVVRLFPPAYVDDPERESEYRRLMRDDLLEQRLATLETFERTVEATQLAENELVAWLAVLNDLRLVLGTRLDVTEELEDLPDDHPDAAALAVYSYLGWLEEQVIAALDPGYGR